MKLIIKLLVLCVLLPLHGCSQVPEQAPLVVAPPSQAALEDVVAPEEEEQEEEEDIVELLLAQMTLRQKIGQLFITTVPEDLSFISNYGIGGVILFSGDIQSEEQVKKLIADMQKEADIPLFVAIDEEGGRVRRTAALDVPHVPPAWEIGQQGNGHLAYYYAKSIANYLAPLGFNLNFAPVADLHSNPANTVIGDRAFHSDPTKSTTMVEFFVKGLEEGGILSTLKHFPGHGDTIEDSHFGSATVYFDINRLREVEFKPFLAGIEAGASMVMVGHILTPSVTDDGLPATFSRYLLEDILRDELGFEGVIVTDALNMGAITHYFGSGQTAVKAIEAGVDLLLMPQCFDEAFYTLLEYVEAGRISEERITESVRRVLKLK